MAGPTGLEPATSGVTGLRSNQLSYDPEFRPGTVGTGRGVYSDQSRVSHARASSMSSKAPNSILPPAIITSAMRAMP
jgi:hypothetical protein